MSINFHCESCKKKIKAPDATGGKWGKCPHCGHRCYIPLPPEPEGAEKLKLAPIDEAEESKYGEMMRETYSITKDILNETAVDDSPDDPVAAAGAAQKKLIKEIIVYLRQMADGELLQAEQTVEKIRPMKDTAIVILEKMTRTEQPEPELADLPPKLLLGLIKELQNRLT